MSPGGGQAVEAGKPSLGELLRAFRKEPSLPTPGF